MHIDSQINKNQPPPGAPVGSSSGLPLPIHPFEEDDKVREEEALLLLCPDDIYVDAMYL